MDHHYDVVISGTGPTGSSAGIRLAGGGLKVLLVEKASFPRTKVCGGLITEKAVELAARCLNLDLSGLILSKSPGLKVFHKKKPLNRFISDRHVYFIQRNAFDDFLQKSALKSGCAIRENSTIGRLGQNYCEIGEDRYYFKHLIGADGMHSNVRDKIGLALERPKMGFGLEVHIPHALRGGMETPRVPEFYFGYLSRGYGWVFPAGDQLTIGLGGLERGKLDVKRAFDAFIADLGLKDAIRGLKVVGAFLPYGDYLRTPGKGNVLLCGDAAGFAEPFSGEGIFYGLHSGILAADSIVEHGGDALAAYTKACRRDIFSVFRQALLFRALIFSRFLQPFVRRIMAKNRHIMGAYMELLCGEIGYYAYIRRLLL